jgi:hypothetical protein
VDSANDPSHADAPAGDKAAMALAVPVYNAGQHVGGTEP